MKNVTHGKNIQFFIKEDLKNWVADIKLEERGKYKIEMKIEAKYFSGEESFWGSYHRLNTTIIKGYSNDIDNINKLIRYCKEDNVFTAHHIIIDGFENGRPEFMTFYYIQAMVYDKETNTILFENNNNLLMLDESMNEAWNKFMSLRQALLAISIN